MSDYGRNIAGNIPVGIKNIIFREVQYSESTPSIGRNLSCTRVPGTRSPGGVSTWTCLDIYARPM